jgi:hypothetical protein
MMGTYYVILSELRMGNDGFAGNNTTSGDALVEEDKI